MPVCVKVNTHYLVEHFVRGVGEKSTLLWRSSHNKCVQLDQKWKSENVFQKILHLKTLVSKQTACMFHFVFVLSSRRENAAIPKKPSFEILIYLFFCKENVLTCGWACKCYTTKMLQPMYCIFHRQHAGMLNKLVSMPDRWLAAEIFRINDSNFRPWQPAAVSSWCKVILSPLPRTQTADENAQSCFCTCPSSF